MLKKIWKMESEKSLGLNVRGGTRSSSYISESLMSFLKSKNSGNKWNICKWLKHCFSFSGYSLVTTS